MPRGRMNVKVRSEIGGRSVKMLQNDPQFDGFYSFFSISFVYSISYCTQYCHSIPSRWLFEFRACSWGGSRGARCWIPVGVCPLTPGCSSRDPVGDGSQLFRLDRTEHSCYLFDYDHASTTWALSVSFGRVSRPKGFPEG